MHPHHQLGFAAVTALWGLLGLAVPSSVAAEPPAPPPYYAVQNVRVVSGDGAVLEGATVLLADGLIEGVGSDLAVPPDARVIDGTDLVLYPGLIDGLTARGLAPAADEGEGARSGGSPFGGGSISRGPEDRPATTPWVSAAEELSADAFGADGTVSKWRSAGFTAAVVSPEKGIFAGQAAMVGLGRVERDDETVEDLVIATPVAHRLTFESAGGFRSFPGSLMGVFAYVKQVLEDARHALRAEAVYAADPTGRERPQFDRALVPLGRALAESEPFLMPGNLPREIDRVVALAREYSLRVVLYGGQGAYARAEELAAAGIPVIVDLDWPEAKKDRDPEADTPFPTLYHRRMAPSTPARLAEAGVRFVFSSGGLASAAEVMEAVRRAVDAGLPEERA
ncbi:MAG: amidohydrolase, partial [Thermoanaerobaculia bacterium]|nr:amidohydrolase [Thermoanaerobaculia bacterium]